MDTNKNMHAECETAVKAEKKEKSEKQKKQVNSKKFQYVRVVASILFALALFLGSSTIIALIDLGECMNEYQNNMRIVLENVEYGYEAQKMPGEIMNIFKVQEYCALSEMAVVALEKNADSKSLQDDIAERIGCEQIYVVKNAEYEKILPQPTKDEWKNLQKLGLLRRENDILTYYAMDNCEIVMKWSIPEIPDNGDLFRFAGEGQELQIVDLKTGLVISSNLEEQCDQKYSDLYGQRIRDISFEEFAGEEVDGSWKTLSGIKVDRQEKMHFYVEHVSEDGKLLIANHVSLQLIVREMFHAMLPQLLLMLLVYGMVMFYAIRLFRARMARGKTSEGKKLFKNIWLDTGFYSHISAFLMVGAFLTLCLTLYLQALIQYSTQNIRANRNLQVASKFVEQTLEDRNNMEDAYREICSDTLIKISDMMELEPKCMNQENLATLAMIIDAKDLTVYDADGVSIASSSSFTGYRLSEEPGHLEYECREFLGGTDRENVLKDRDKGNWWILVKRKDAPGMLVMKMGSDWLDTMTYNLTVGDALACTTFDQSDKLFVLLDEPGKTFRIKPNSFEIEELDGAVDERLLSGNFTGQIRIDGISYYINELRTDKVLYISALQEDRNWARVVSGMICELVGFLLLWAMVLIVFGITGNQYIEFPEHKNAKLREVLSRDKLTDSAFQKMLSRMLKLTVALLFVVILVEVRFYSNTVIRYLFGSQWEKKLNLFSITIILFYAIAARIVCQAATRVIMLIAENMGQRSVTIGHMICSLLRFGALMAWSINTLVQLGIELRYLLTGAGIAGIVIGYACQGVINDLLTGLFIVFEGNFQVGDWVRVDDWRGEVLTIGVRTTKIGYGGDVKIFHNSQLHTITVLSHTMDGALCNINIAYEEDVDKVLELIRGHKRQYQKACPHIIEGPGIHGVTALGDNGVTLRVWAQIDHQQNVAAAERAILKETKKLFDENGITIPFPQLVIHSENEE